MKMVKIRMGAFPCYLCGKWYDEKHPWFYSPQIEEGTVQICNKCAEPYLNDNTIGKTTYALELAQEAKVKGKH